MCEGAVRGSSHARGPYEPRKRNLPMIPALRNACHSSSLLAVVVLSGCYVSVEPATRFEGTPESFSVPFTTGTQVHIVSVNGNVKVVGGGAGDKVGVTFHPFVMDKD